MRKNQLLVVIHAVNEEQVLRNARVAFENYADGIFLINHDISPQRLLGIYAAVDDEVAKDRFVGLNFLGVTPMRAIDLLSKAWNASAIWMDDVGLVEGEEDSINHIYTPMRVRDTLKHLKYQGLFFGGVAFKYQKPVRDLAHVTAAAYSLVDVITTSGPATGSPPNIEKILTMRRAVPDAKIAVASGMTPENVEPFLDHVDYFLVATGISKSHTELDSARVRLMAAKMRR